MFTFALIGLDNLIDRFNPPARIYVWSVLLDVLLIAAVTGVPS